MTAAASVDREARAPAPAYFGSMGVAEMLAIAFKNRWTILAALILPPVVAVALLVLLPRVYRAQSDILVKTGREYMAQTEGESPLTAPSSTKQEGINSEIALLTSRAVAEATIAAIGLETLYPDIVADPPSSGSILDAAVEQFGKDFSVDPVKLSNVISASFDAPSTGLAKTVLNQVIKIYIAKHTEVFAGSRAESYQGSINQAMQEIQRLDEARTRLKLDHGIYDIAAQRQALINQRVDAQNHLQDALNRQAKLQGRLDSLAQARSRIGATATSTVTERNDEAVHAREAMIDLRQAEAAMAARYGAGNPDLQRVRSQIATIQHTIGATSTDRTNVATSPSTLRQGVDQELVMGRAELTTMQAEIDRFRSLVTDLTGELRRLEQAELGLRATELRIDVLTDNLRAMQARFEQARTQEQTELAHQVSVVQVADAIASEKPVKPRKLLYGLGGILGGILLAGVAAFVAIFTNTTAVTEHAAERMLGLPVLAVLPVRDRLHGPVTLELE